MLPGARSLGRQQGAWRADHVISIVPSWTNSRTMVLLRLAFEHRAHGAEDDGKAQLATDVAEKQGTKRRYHHHVDLELWTAVVCRNC